MPRTARGSGSGCCHRTARPPSISVCCRAPLICLAARSATPSTPPIFLPPKRVLALRCDIARRAFGANWAKWGGSRISPRVAHGGTRRWPDCPVEAICWLRNGLIGSSGSDPMGDCTADRSAGMPLRFLPRIARSNSRRARPPATGSRGAAGVPVPFKSTGRLVVRSGSKLCGSKRVFPVQPRPVLL